MITNATCDEERDPSPACRHCEYADITEEEPLFVFCHLCNREIFNDNLCEHYIYDLLKRGTASKPLPLSKITPPILEPIDF